MVALTSGVKYWNVRKSARGSVQIHTVMNLHAAEPCFDGNHEAYAHDQGLLTSNLCIVRATMCCQCHDNSKRARTLVVTTLLAARK